MSDLKISQLPADASVTGTEQVPVNDAGTNKRVTTQQIADLAGSGLPSQWTDGGNGNVTATTDDATKTAFTIKGTAGQEAIRTPLFQVIDDTDQQVLFTDIEHDSVGATFHIGLPSGTNRGISHHMTLDDNNGVASADSGYYAYCVEGYIGFDLFVDYVTPANSYSTIFLHEQTSQTNPLIHATNGVGGRVFGVLADGAPVIAQTTAPADGDFSAGEMGLWFDDTNGAATPKWKGKQADGTVVSGTLGGSSGSTSFASIAKFGVD